MICLLVFAFSATTFYFAGHLFLLRKAIRKASEDLQDISLALEENRVVKLGASESDLEKLLEIINKNLKAIREERLRYQQEEMKFREQIENISHDLRTPLTGIFGYLKMIDAGHLEQEDQEYLEIALRKSHTLQSLVSQFYELSRVTSEDFHPELKPVDCARVLRESCLDHYSLLEKEHLQVQMDVPESPAVICGNTEALERIFSNLIQNSARYAQHEFYISLRQAIDSKTVKIQFENDISPELILDEPNSLFDRFYTQEQSRTRGSTGLGLTISRCLTESMGGQIHAQYNHRGNHIFLTFIMEFRVI